MSCQGSLEIKFPNHIQNKYQNISVSVTSSFDQNEKIESLQITLEGSAVENKYVYSEYGLVNKGQNQTFYQGLKFFINSNVFINKKDFTEFTIKVSAPGYLSNFKHIKVTALDSLQFVDIVLVKLADTPKDVLFQNSLIQYSNSSIHVPGGLQSVHTNQGEKTFLLASAIQSTILSSPLLFNLILGDDSHNPETGLPIQVGDFIELWFLPENASSWEKLPKQAILTDGRGRKFVSTTIEKAGTILAGYGLDPCLEPLLITLEKSCEQDQTLCIRLLQGNKQVLAERRIAAKSSGPYMLYLPKNLDYTLSMHAGTSLMANQVYQNDLPNCAALALIKIIK
jgi:hypothetical protein